MAFMAFFSKIFGKKMMEYFISNDAKKNIVQVDDDKHQQFWRNDIKLKGSIVPIMVSYVEAYSLILMLLKNDRLTMHWGPCLA